MVSLFPAANQARGVWKHLPQLSGTGCAPQHPEDSAGFLPEVSLRDHAALPSECCALTAVSCRSEGPAVTLEVLRSLAAVGRFDMAVMFMSTAERKVVSDLFDVLRQADLEASVVAALQKKYGL